MIRKLLTTAAMISLVSAPVLSFAISQANKPLPEKFSTCKKFLEDPEVIDQIKYEALNLADSDSYQITEDKGVCTLKAIDEDDHITYVFTSVSPDNYTFDGKTFTLKLYDLNKPKIENVVEGTYDVDTDDVIDAAFSFPSVQNTAAADAGNDLD